MLDEDYTLESHFMESLILNTESFDEAVHLVQNAKLTSPSHFILGGLSQDEGVVISRDFDHAVDIRWLTDEDWFVVQTNSDIWTSPDSRYLNAVEFMEDLGQGQITLDGKSIIEKVLFKEGVVQDDTIFTTTITANPSQKVLVYDTPDSGAQGYNLLEAFIFSGLNLN